MRPARVRVSLRRMMITVAIVALLLAAARTLLQHLGPRNGFYHGKYGYLGSDWKWHEVRGNIIFVKDGIILVD